MLVSFPLFRPKRRLSKYEASLHFAFRQKRILDVAAGDVVVVKQYELPDVIVIADGDQSSTSITLPTVNVLDQDKLITVLNKDAAEAVTINGVACAAGEATVLRFSGSAYSELYAVALA